MASAASSTVAEPTATSLPSRIATPRQRYETIDEDAPPESGAQDRPDDPNNSSNPAAELSFQEILDDVDRFSETFSECNEKWAPPEVVPASVELLYKAVDSMTTKYGRGLARFGENEEDDAPFVESVSRISKIASVLEEFPSNSTTATAKENAACALLRLSQIKENKATIGRSGGIPLLVNLLECGAFRGKKDASTALYSLCSIKQNKIRAIESEIMKPLVELMADFGSNMVDFKKVERPEGPLVCNHRYSVL